MGLYLGIDFGTSTNYVVRYDLEKDIIEPERIGKFGSNNVIDNVIYYGKDNVIIGEVASKKYITDPENVVKYVKRELERDGKNIYIPALNLEIDSQRVVKDILEEIKRLVESKHGGEKVEGVVLSVPFAFLHKERTKIKLAAEMAGIKVLGLIEEPVAAALSYIRNDKYGFTGSLKKILVFDLGGGTLDVTIFQCYKYEDQVVIEVLNTDGDKELGGKDVDDLLMNKLQEMSKYYLRDIKVPAVQKSEMLKFMDVVSEAKEELSEYDESNIYLSLNGGTFEIDEDITLDEFDSMLRNNNFISKIEEIIENVVMDIDLEYKDIEDVILVGGSSKLVAIKELIEDLFGKEPIELKDPSLLVGEGAALYAGTLLKQDTKYKIIPRLSQSIGIAENGKFKSLIKKNSFYRCKSDISWYELERGDCRDVNLEIFQGNSSNLNRCSKVGSVRFNKSNFIYKIGVQLALNENGIITYKLYDKDNGNNLILVEEGELNG